MRRLRRLGQPEHTSRRPAASPAPVTRRGLVEALRRFEDLGVDEVNLIPTSADPVQVASLPRSRAAARLEPRSQGLSPCWPWWAQRPGPPGSAALLVTGAMALALATLLTPTGSSGPDGRPAVREHDSRWPYAVLGDLFWPPRCSSSACPRCWCWSQDRGRYTRPGRRGHARRSGSSASPATRCCSCSSALAVTDALRDHSIDAVPRRRDCRSSSTAGSWRSYRARAAARRAPCGPARCRAGCRCCCCSTC